MPQEKPGTNTEADERTDEEIAEDYTKEALAAAKVCKEKGWESKECQHDVIERFTGEYADTVKACVDHGVDSPECRKEALLEGGKAVATYYGVDPEVVAAAEECLDSGDSEVCAKASAKLAATAACTVATEGAAGPLCAKLAPFVVDAIWPIAGPPLVAVWDVAWSLNSAVVGGLSKFVEDLFGAFGIDLSGEADPTVMDIYYDVRDVGKGILIENWQSAMRSLQSADFESRKELHLPIPISLRDKPPVYVGPNGSVSAPGSSSSSFVDAYDPSSVEFLETMLRQQPGWSGPIVVVVRVTGANFMVEDLLEYHLEVYNRPVPNSELGPHDMRLQLPDMDVNSTKVSIEPSKGFTPWAFTFSGFGNQRKIFAEAYTCAIETRANALKNATTEAVGSIVSNNTRKASLDRRIELAEKIQAKEQGSSLLWWVLGLGAVGAAVWYGRSRWLR